MSAVRIVPPAIRTVDEGERYLRWWSNSRLAHDGEMYCQPWQGSDLEDRLRVATCLLMVRERAWKARRP